MKSLGSSLDLFNLPSHTEDYRFKRKIDIKDWNQPINDILAIEVQ